MSQWLMVKNDGWWYSPHSAESEAEAAREAVLQNGRFISNRYDVALKDALILLTMVGRLSVSRTGKWAAHQSVVNAGFSIEEVERALRGYRG